MMLAGHFPNLPPPPKSIGAGAKLPVRTVDPHCGASFSRRLSPRPLGESSIMRGASKGEREFLARTGGYR